MAMGCQLSAGDSGVAGQEALALVRCYLMNRILGCFAATDSHKHPFPADGCFCSHWDWQGLHLCSLSLSPPQVVEGVTLFIPIALIWVLEENVP